MAGIIKTRYNLICKFCNKPFVGKNFNTRFCRQLCSQHYRVRQNPALEALRHRKYDLKSKYKITLEDYNLMLEIQNYKCANPGCKVKFNSGIGTKPCLDHDHHCCKGESTCGKCLRSILCESCNHGIGKFKDDIEKLKGAIDYLEIHKNLLTKTKESDTVKE